MAPRGRTWNHVCSKCNKSFPSGRALGGHMSRHWRIIEQLKRTPSPPAIAVDVHVSPLSPSDEETLLLSSGRQCPVFSSCNSLRKHVREHSEMKVLRKPVEGAVGLMEYMATADGDYSVMLSPIVKGKRSKRDTPALNFDVMDAAVTLLLLSEHAKKISAYEDCYVEDMDSLSPNVSKDVKLYAFDHPLVRPAVFKKLKVHKNSAYEDCYGQWKKDSNLIPNVPNHAAYDDFCGQCEKDKSLISTVPKKDSKLIPNVPYKDSNLITNVPDKDNNLIPNVHEEVNTSITNVSKKEVELNVLDCGLDGDNELRKLRTDNSVQMKCGDPSATVKVKRHQCNACGKSFGSGQALGGHMTLRHPRCNHQRHGLADCPDSVVMEEQKKKLEWVSKLLDLGVPALTDGYYYIVASLSEPQPGGVTNVH